MKKLFSLIALLTLTMSAVAQVQKFYEWKNGVYTERSVSEIDSITFALPEVSEPVIPEYAVNLGLPSGTLWADRNVGADSPEGHGDYFAWGETTSKIYCYYETYKWCNAQFYSLTKYCTKSDCGYKGFTDNITTLELEDDAATANWGDEWRMPTKTEFGELVDNCTWTWTIKNSVNGYKITGPNGNSIFLPASGLRNLTYYPELVGSRGYYWSSSLNESDPQAVSILYISSSYYDTIDDTRYYGFTVRAVVK